MHLYDESLNREEDIQEKTTQALSGSLRLMDKLDEFLKDY